MTGPVIAVIDVGKTNVKLALVDAETLCEVAVETRANIVRPGPPWPHFDLDGHWNFFLAALTRFAADHAIAGISITTHGAACVLLDGAADLAAPMLDYEHVGPDSLAADYDRIRPPFTATGSPRLPNGLNLGAQLHWMFAQERGLAARTAQVLTYPQYWAWRLTGVAASEVTSLGCHTDLWEPRAQRFSPLVARLDLAGKLPPVRLSTDILGPVRPEIAARTGLAPGTPVACGIHDSNASLFPYLLAREGPFSVVSTGTWVVCMAVGGQAITLDPARDTLVNVDARGAPTPSSRFMGGREYETIRSGSDAVPTAADRAEVLDGEIMFLPSAVPGSGPFPDRTGGWRGRASGDGARALALSWYLAMMTDSCLDLIGASGLTIVEGPFARNADYLEMLAALRNDGVEATTASTGTSAGTALLLGGEGPLRETIKVSARNRGALRAYAQAWRDQLTR